MLEEAVFGLPHEQKSILVDAAQLKRSKKSHDTECTPVETEPVHMDHVHTSAGNVMATGFERIQREKRKKKKEKRKKKKEKRKGRYRERTKAGEDNCTWHTRKHIPKILNMIRFCTKVALTHSETEVVTTTCKEKCN